MGEPMRAVCVLAVLAVAVTARAQEAGWTGQFIVGTKWPQEITFGDQVNGKQEWYKFEGHYPIRVREDRDGWLRVFDGHREAWAKKSEFVLSRDAPAYFTDRVRTNPGDLSAWLARGQGWLDREEYDNAVKDISEVIRLDPRYPDAFTMRGYAWKAKGDLDRALKDYDEAIRLDSKYNIPFHNRGLVWYAKGEFDRALKDFDESVRLDPKDTSPVFGRSQVLMSARRPGAVEGFRSVLKLLEWKGTESTAAVVLGSLAARLEKDDAAAEKLLTDSAGKLKADWPEPVVRFLRGDLDEPALLKLATDKEKEAEAHAYLGVDHLIRGRPTEARAHLRWVRDNAKRTSGLYPVAVVELARLEKAAVPER